MFILWLKFAICMVLILVSGTRLSETAHKIVQRGKLSAGIMGVFILALITSFPELSTSVAAAWRVNAPNLGIGDLIGSVVINLMIITILDFKLGNRSLFSLVKREHLVTCAFSLLTLGIFIVSISISGGVKEWVGLFNIGLDSILIFSVYIGFIFYNKRHFVSNTLPADRPTGDHLKINFLFILYALIIIGCGFWLASLGKEIVDKKGWNEMYFGTIMIALATSLPEIVVSFVAVSLGSVDMALANILGSNLLNMAIIPVMDGLFRRGYLLSYLSSSHIYSALLGIILTLIVFFSIFYKLKKSYGRFSVGTIGLILVFLIGNILLFNLISR